MALIPAAVVGMSGNNVKMTSSTPDTAVKSDDKSQTVINTAVSLCGKDFCDEALKAALIIAESNYLSGTKMKTNDNSSDKELYNRLSPSKCRFPATMQTITSPFDSAYLK